MIQSNIDVSTLNSQAAFNKLESLSRTRSDEKEIDRVAGEFQSMCYSQLVKSMFATTENTTVTNMKTANLKMIRRRKIYF
jgi:Rod binding domain-containing protein